MRPWARGSDGRGDPDGDIRDRPFGTGGRRSDADAQPARPAQQLHGRDARRNACRAGRDCSDTIGTLPGADRSRPRLLRRPGSCRPCGRARQRSASTSAPRSRITTSRCCCDCARLRMPTVCAVNGVAAGAGANIPFACDLVLAAQSASFIQSFSKLGLVPDCGGTWWLPRLVGPARAMGLALLGDKLRAAQAEEWGLIWRCVEDDQLMPSRARACTATRGGSDARLCTHA